MEAGGVSADKKGAARKGASLVFLDESGFSITPTVRRTFAPRGCTPILRCWKRHGKISAISAITVSPRRRRLGLYFVLLPDDENVCAHDVVRFLRLLKRRLRRRFTIVWDRSNTHDKSKVVRTHLARHPEITTERFPGYAPELNPDEQVWMHTKWGRLHNYVPDSIANLRRRLAAELRCLCRRPDLLASFIRHAGLPLVVRCA